jgi:MFS superfamily sulfate permease-like transporter
LINQYQPRIVALECSAIPNFEYTALAQLNEFEEKLADAGITLWLASLNTNAFRAMERSVLGKRLTRERMHYNLREALKVYLAREKE